jgi:NADP-dependent 3-hydroxy acid dehydrogenase YdfG
MQFDENSTRALSLDGRVAVVTGASSGIGRAVAIELARHKAKLIVQGRDASRLENTSSIARQFSSVVEHVVDLRDHKQLQAFGQHVIDECHRIDILIHCAGSMQSDVMEAASIEDFDAQYAVNIRAPYFLTQCSIPLLAKNHGQIVFLNSSLGLSAKRPGIGQYAATKHGLKAIADCLREELNSKGIRVLSVYLGRTATPMQKSLFRKEGKEYRPDLLLQPETVASVIIHALTIPLTAEITDINLRPMQKSY